MSELNPETEAGVRAATEATGHLTDHPFKPCPPGCAIPRGIHRHYEREPGDFFKLAAPMPCCGREYARVDEVTFFDQCAWCREDGKSLPGAVLLFPAYTTLRTRRR